MRLASQAERLSRRAPSVVARCTVPEINRSDDDHQGEERAHAYDELDLDGCSSGLHCLFLRLFPRSEVAREGDTRHA